MRGFVWVDVMFVRCVCVCACCALCVLCGVRVELVGAWRRRTLSAFASWCCGLHPAVGLLHGRCASPTPPSHTLPQFANYPSPWAVFSAINTDALFICPARRTARWATAAGLNAFVYVYGCCVGDRDDMGGWVGAICGERVALGLRVVLAWRRGVLYVAAVFFPPPPPPPPSSTPTCTL
jgi:hypothetical protein